MEYYEMEDFDEEEVQQKPNLLSNKKIIIVILAILFFVCIIALSPKNDVNSKYHNIEEQMINKAKQYIQNNNLSTISNEIYLDSYKLDLNLDNECDRLSGVLYNGVEYTPYLKCTNYESKIIDNSNDLIKLNGDDVIIHADGIPFYDPGYVSDNKVEVSGFVGKKEGVYNLYYYIKGDTKFLTRKVILVDNNELKERYPVITLNGEEVVYVLKNTEYNDEGVIAVDSSDGTISQNVIVDGNIDTNTLGKQTLTYRVTNSKGYQSVVERIVNVVESDIEVYYYFSVSPTNQVNSDVIITINIYGELYEYTILPSGEKVTDNRINYTVNENGTYTFTIYDKTGNITVKDIEVNNIDIDPPTATCEAIIYSDHSKIDVYSTTNKPISTYEYQINNTSVKKNSLASYTSNIKDVKSASVVIEDSVGNKNTITCEVIPYNNWKLDYSKTNVYLKENDKVIKKYRLDDYLKGSVYLLLSDIDYNDYSSSQLLELYKAFLVIKKAELFSTGKYSIYNKQLIYNIDEAKYCDVYVGCKSVSKNGKSFYLANDIELNVDQDYGSIIQKMDDDILNILNRAYENTKKEVVINKDFDDVLVKYNSSYVYINDNVKKAIIKDIQNNKTYREVIQSELPSYKIYNINNYSNKYEEALKSKSKYYWPIGSSNIDKWGLYGGTPESTTVISYYGANDTDNKVHEGISIKGTCGSTKVIASKAGRVSNIGSDSKHGDYVIIYHDNGVSFLYGSLSKSSIAVRAGDSVKKGQIIGFVGKKDDTCMLYLEASLNGTTVDPSEYISIDNLRPETGDKIIYVEGGTVKRSVCLSLLASGFSTDATAAIMANMQRESNFNLRSLGDGGTSVGLCQWHNTRYNRLASHCGNKIYTTECQLDYLLYELKNNYKSTYEYILGNNKAYDIGNYFCFHYEVPAARITSCPQRGEIAEKVYVPYVLNNCN